MGQERGVVNGVVCDKLYDVIEAQPRIESNSECTQQLRLLLVRSYRY